MDRTHTRTRTFKAGIQDPSTGLNFINLRTAYKFAEKWTKKERMAPHKALMQLFKPWWTEKHHVYGFDKMV